MQGATSHPKLQAVQIAKMINVQCNGAVIAPWEVDHLDEEWIDVFIGLTELPQRRAVYQQFDNRLAEIRRNHPTYRKYQN